MPENDYEFRQNDKKLLIIAQNDDPSTNHKLYLISDNTHTAL